MICQVCWESIKPRAGSFCLSCGRFFGGAGEPHPCGNCLEKRPPFAKHRSCAKYDGTLKDVILLFKYRRFEVLGKGLAAFVYKATEEETDLWEGVEAIVPVPLHPKRERQRGFNQAGAVAAELAKRKKIELIERKLIKAVNIPPQTSLEASGRVKNVRGAYRVAEGDNLRGKVVLLVDDVYTTGATIRECSSVLRRAGVKEVRALTIAQA